MSHQLSQRAWAYSQTQPIWPSECGLALKSPLASMEEPEDPAGLANMAVLQRVSQRCSGSRLERGPGVSDSPPSPPLPDRRPQPLPGASLSCCRHLSLQPLS